jgi:hypothetical protein
MKIGGEKLQVAKPEIVVLPRTGDDGQPCDIVFKCAPVTDYEEFDQLCPQPEPPKKTYPADTGKPPEVLVDHPEYLKALQEYSARRSAWTFIKSLSATEGLEWETVKMGDPSTWVGWQDELRESGINDFETSKILQGIMVANSLSEERMQEARERFFTAEAAE